MNNLLKKLFIAPIQFYKFFLSPWVGQSCRFTPTCSSYAIEAINSWGVRKGLFLSFRRIGRCNPWCQGGHDPVPKKCCSPAHDKGLTSRCHTD